MISRKRAPGAVFRIAVTVAFIALVVIGGLMAVQRLDRVKNDVQTWLTITAIAIGAVYFIVRLVAGEFWSGLSLQVELQRSDAKGGNDYLAISARLKNERATSLVLYSARAIVRGTSGAAAIVSLGEGFRRYDTSSQAIVVDLSVGPLRVPTSSNARLTDFLVNPGDEMSIVGVAEVPPTEPVVVDVVVIGRAYLGFVETQWVSSAVTLPR